MNDSIIIFTMDIFEIISQLIGSEDKYIFGFADLTGLLPPQFKGYDHAIVFGKRLDDSIMDNVETGPTPDYHQLYKDTNNALSDLVHSIARRLETKNIACRIMEPTVSDDELDDTYYKTLRMDFSHKMAATRAGLGWIGKSDLLISKRFGPRLRLASILVDQPLPATGKPIEKSRCGKCNLCVQRCPANAANGKLWDIHTDRDEFYNPFKCREMCLELSRKNLNQQVSICGICVAVCPIGKRNKRRETSKRTGENK